MMEDGYVDIEMLINDYEYTEEAPELFDDNFFNNLKDTENDD